VCNSAFFATSTAAPINLCSKFVPFSMVKNIAPDFAEELKTRAYGSTTSSSYAQFVDYEDAYFGVIFAFPNRIHL